MQRVTMYIRSVHVEHEAVQPGHPLSPLSYYFSLCGQVQFLWYEIGVVYRVLLGVTRESLHSESRTFITVDV